MLATVISGIMTGRLPADHLIERGHEFVYIQYNGADYSDVGYNDSEAQNKMRSLLRDCWKEGNRYFR